MPECRIEGRGQRSTIQKLFAAEVLNLSIYSSLRYNKRVEVSFLCIVMTPYIVSMIPLCFIMVRLLRLL